MMVAPGPVILAVLMWLVFMAAVYVVVRLAVKHGIRSTLPAASTSVKPIDTGDTGKHD